VAIGAEALLGLLGEMVRSPNHEVLRQNFARIMAMILGAEAAIVMGQDVTKMRCVSLGSWPQQGEREAEFDLQGKEEADRLMLFALKSKRFQMENLNSQTRDLLLATLKSTLFGADRRAPFALIPPFDETQTENEISSLIFFALLGGKKPSAETIKLARLFAAYCRDLNQTLLDLNMRAGASENLARSLALAEKERKKMRDTLSEMMSYRLVGSCEPMNQLRRNLTRFASSDAPIFIHGETGTGKELAAREIHRLSRRHNKAFVAINVTALPQGLEESELFGFVKGAFTGADSNRLGTFAQADGGTLFFDEIGDMSLDLQAKILRVLQEKTFRPLGSHHEVQSDFRLISATHRNLEEMVAQGRFREDLFYRLTIFSLEIPPLRARSQDMAELCSHFLAQMAEQDDCPPKILAPSALRELERLNFPGNVRQLHALLLRASYLSDDSPTLEAHHIHEATKNGASKTKYSPPLKEGSLKTALESYERDLLLKAYQHHDGSRAKMAAALQIPLRTLADKMKKYELEKKHETPRDKGKIYSFDMASA